MSAEIKPRTTDVPIFQGDDLARIEEAQAQFNRQEQERQLGKGGRLNPEITPAQEAAEAYDAVVAEALPRAVIARVQALPRKTYRRLLAEHGPREDNEADEALGYNEETFLDAVLEHFDGETGARSIVHPEFSSGNALVAWLDQLSDGQFTELATAAIRVNIGGQPDPKASLASQAAQMYAATLQSPASTG